MAHPHADMAAQMRAFLLRSGEQADARLVDAFLASDAFGNIAADYTESLLREFLIFAASQLPDAPEASPAPKASLFQFEDLSNVNPIPEPVSAPTAPRPLQPDVDFRLANARAGEPYRHKLVPLTGENPDLVLLQVNFPSALNFQADLADGSVTGVAPIADEYKVEVIYGFKSEGQDCRRKALVPLLVNPDPKSLWKDLPSDRSAPFWKDDAACAAITGPGTRVIAASKRGRSHAHVGGFRDDDFFIARCPDADWTIAIVADGAGSAKYSREGSRLVCESAGAFLVETLQGAAGAAVAHAAASFHAARSGAGPLDAVEAARQQLRNALYSVVGHAAYHGVKAMSDAVERHAALQPTLKDFSTTALIAITRRFAFGTLCAAYWVGDGAIGVYSKDQGITLLGEVDSGEYAGQTRFLDPAEVSAEALLRRTRFALVDDMTALIVMSDGVSDPKFDSEASLERAPAWHALWNELERSLALDTGAHGAEQRLLSWLDFWSQGNHDDRTIVLVCQEPA